MSGGVPARRAIVRWAWRLFRREWRQQVLVIALITAAVGLAVAATSAGYNAARPPEFEYGTADHRLVSELPDTVDRQALDAYYAAVEEWFGPIDVISQRRVSIPGSTEAVEVRAQDPDGPYGSPMVSLLEGKYPSHEGEVALTGELAETLQLDLGGKLGLAGQRWSVVGLVENPTNLDDDFALVPPALDMPMHTVTVLVKGTEEQLRTFPDDFDPGPGYVESQRNVADSTAAGAGALAASAVALLLVCLVGATSFVVVAQRRLRQLGMLATVGATRKHLRLVVMANGTAVGAVAALLGAALGVVGWIALAPRLEEIARHRIDRFDVPWPLVGLGMVLAVAAAGLAAWWPARTLARVPVTQALSGRPPRPRPARRSLLLAVPLIGLGVTCLAMGNDVAKDTGNELLILAGALAIPLGIALLSPPAIRLLSPVATRLPLGARLALRDLIRYRARSGAALAAISLGLGISVAIVVAAAATEYRPGEGNLSDRQLLFLADPPDETGGVQWVPDLTPARLTELESTVARVAGRLDGPVVVPLDVPLDPEAKEPRAGELLQPPIQLGRRVNETTYRDSGPIYVATPEVLGYLDLDPASSALDTDLIIHRDLLAHIGGQDLSSAIRDGALVFIGAAEKNLPMSRVQPADIAPYSSTPRTLITPESVQRHGWETARVAWFVESGEPLTAQQLAEAREAAAASGLTIESRSGQEGLGQLRNGATAVGFLLGLCILAMTVGLIRSEAAADLRTLAATGASSRIRRTLTGVTAGALACLGALLGATGAYAAMAAGYRTDIDRLLPVPIPELLAILIGLPVLAAAAGWLLAGREPPAVARTPIE